MANITQLITRTKAAVHYAVNLPEDADASEHSTMYWVSEPGLGKTSGIKQIARDLDLKLVIVDLAQSEPTDICGTNWIKDNPDGSRSMTRLKPEWFPDVGTKGILFFDEVAQGEKASLNVVGQVIHELRAGPHKLPHGWVCVAASNGIKDKAGVQRLPSQLKDRFNFQYLEVDLESVIKYFRSIGADERICAYLRFRPEWLHRFDAAADSCPTPRAWHRVSNVLKWALGWEDMLECIAGEVGPAAAGDFAGFLKLYESCPDIDELIASPMAADVPTDMGVMYAICAALATRMNNANADNIIKFLNRLPQGEFAAFVIKDAYNRDKELKSNKAIRAWCLDNGHVLLV